MFASSKTATVSGGAPDDKFNYVTMLLHGDGTNGAQNNTFLDSSTNNFTITRNGNTTQGSFSPYGANWSNNFGTGNYLTLSSSISLSSSLTVECWFNLTSAQSSFQMLAGESLAGSGEYISLTSTGVEAQFGTTGATVSSITYTFTVGVWYHFALVRNGTTVSIYINGVAQSVTNSTQSLTMVLQYVGVGYDSIYPFTGYISNFRINTTAVYTSAFTPSTTPLTAISGTSLLTCQSNRFIDNSASPLTITATGSPSVQRFNPFGTSTAYSTSVISGSAYFDGTGDYLATPSNAAFNLSSGDWTIELWVYLTADYDTYYGGHLIGSEDGNTSSGGWGMVLRSGSITLVGNSNTQGIYATDFKLNTWNHIALVRSGTGASSVSLYFNGLPYTATGNGAGNPTFTSTNGPVYVAEHPSYPVTAVKGYFSNVRVVKGTAVYAINQSSITVPTAPFTAITNTSVLLSGTNAGIFDNAMMNDLETVGNAQISTSVVKYGTGSLAFDGTGDRLTSASSPNIAFGTGDFTVEAWIYTNTLSGERGFIQTSTTAGGLEAGYTTGIVIAIGVSPYAIYTNIGGTSVTSGTTYIAINTWYHVALTRASGSVRLFINGTLVGGPTTAAADLTGQNIVIGGYYSTTYLWNGYVDDLRITKGYARYTANFTAPTSALSDTGPY